MALTGTAPLIQAIVQTMRANVTLKAAVSGFYEGLAPRGVRRPFVIYQIAYAPYTYDFGSQSAIQMVGIDVFAIAENSVDARNIDGLVQQTLQNAALQVSGQSTLICRRVADVVIPPDLDGEGKKIYQVGGTYEIWTAQ
jgi:hypothetical protein